MSLYRPRSWRHHIYGNSEKRQRRMTLPFSDHIAQKLLLAVTLALYPILNLNAIGDNVPVDSL
jgi:hypothetical protein